MKRDRSNSTQKCDGCNGLSVYFGGLKMWIRYECEHCRKIHSTAEDARECEESHPKPVDIHNYRYESADENPYLKYPEKIIVKMNDHSIVQYRYECVLA